MARKAHCDQCGEAKPLNQYGGLPDGWLTLTEPVPAPNPDTQREFCSFVCLYGFASSRLADQQTATRAPEPTQVN